MTSDFVLMRINIDHIAHLEFRHVHFDWQSSAIFHGIEEDGSNHTTNTHTACAYVGYVGDVFTHVPKDGVCGRLARGASTDNVTDVGQRVSFRFQFLNLANRPYNAEIDGINADRSTALEHCQGMEGYIRPAPSVRCRG